MKPRSIQLRLPESWSVPKGLISMRSSAQLKSGGCGSIQDIIDVFEKTNVDAALVASLFHFNEATVEDVRNECKKHGINVRRTR